MRDPIPGYDIVPDKLFCSHGSNCLVGGRFHPLSKVVDRHQTVAMIVGSWRVYGTNDIDPLGGERPRRRHAVQFLQGRVYEVSMDLAVVALAHKLAAVCLHG